MKRLIVIIALLVSPSALHAQSPSFQGKTVTIIVGTAAGDLCDANVPTIYELMDKYKTTETGRPFRGTDKIRMPVPLAMVSMSVISPTTSKSIDASYYAKVCLPRQVITVYGFISCMNHSLGISRPRFFSLAAL